MTAGILDLGILILIALSAFIGLMRGFIKEALSLVTWVAAFAVTLLYMKPLAADLPFGTQSEVMRLGIAIAILFFGTLVIGAIINHFISSAVSSIGLGKIDHVLGGIFGVVRGALIITLLVMVIGSVTAYSKQSWWMDSHLMPWFENWATTVKAMIPDKLPAFIEESMSMVHH